MIIQKNQSLRNNFKKCNVFRSPKTYWGKRQHSSGIKTDSMTSALKSFWWISFTRSRVAISGTTSPTSNVHGEGDAKSPTDKSHGKIFFLHVDIYHLSGEKRKSTYQDLFWDLMAAASLMLPKRFISFIRFIREKHYSSREEWILIFYPH